LEGEILSRQRHIELIEQAVFHLKNAGEGFENRLPEDLIAIDLTAAYKSFGEIIGAEVNEDLLDRIFSEFCLGK
jgi:tRNA modification GTPase